MGNPVRAIAWMLTSPDEEHTILVVDRFLVFGWFKTDGSAGYYWAENCLTVPKAYAYALKRTEEIESMGSWLKIEPRSRTLTYSQMEIVEWIRMAQAQAKRDLAPLVHDVLQQS